MFGGSKAVARELEQIGALLQGLTEAVAAAHTASLRGESLEQRVVGLESTLAKTMADAEAWYIKADARTKAALAAESRERRFAETSVGAQNGDDGEWTDEEVAAAYAAAGVSQGDAPPSDQERVSPMPGRLGRAAEKSALIAAKFGRR